MHSCDSIPLRNDVLATVSWKGIMQKQLGDSTNGRRLTTAKTDLLWLLGCVVGLICEGLDRLLRCPASQRSKPGWGDNAAELVTSSI